MYTDNAYWQNQMHDFEDFSHPLFVCSCGTFRLFEDNYTSTSRPNGRVDWQLLYIASGKTHFKINGNEEIISAGHMVLYRPGEEQFYSYYGEDRPEVYWVHFTGSDVADILYKYGITDTMHVIKTGTSLDFKKIFHQIIRELKLCKYDYEKVLTNYLELLFILIHRSIMAAPRAVNKYLTDEMEAAVKYFHEFYHQPISIEEYATKHNMSVSWFIRNFKEYTGSTPAQYIMSLRISNAQSLLERTSYNITEVSTIVGYDNPLYFSRIFKKQVGISPSDFRKQLES